MTRNAPQNLVDPTANVLQLVEAAMRRQDDLRDAETRRINELAEQKLTFDLELAKILRANQDAAATLLATQLKEVKNDLSDRTAKLEQFRWETGGRGMGMNALLGWAMSLLMAAIAITALFFRH